MPEQIDSLREEALRALEAAEDAAALKAWRIAYLGRKGRVSELMKLIGTLPKEERPAFGQAANELKRTLQAAFEERKATLGRRVSCRGIGRHPAWPPSRPWPSAHHHSDAA